MLQIRHTIAQRITINMKLFPCRIGGRIKLIDSVKQGDLTKAKALIKADPALTACKDKSDMTPLHLAALNTTKGMAEPVGPNVRHHNCQI
jgi:hypothetical protein